MKKTLKYRILAWRCKRQNRTRKYIDYEHAQKILLLYESTNDKQDESIRQIANDLNADGKQTTVCRYTAAGQTATKPDGIWLCKKDLGVTGKPSRILKSIAQQQFDIVIDLTLSPCLPLLYILLYANASCKAGLQHTDIPLLDFIISYPKEKHKTASQSQTDMNILFRHILFYLKNIRSND